MDVSTKERKTDLFLVGLHEAFREIDPCDFLTSFADSRFRERALFLLSFKMPDWSSIEASPAFILSVSLHILEDVKDLWGSRLWKSICIGLFTFLEYNYFVCLSAAFQHSVVHKWTLVCWFVLRNFWVAVDRPRIRVDYYDVSVYEA